MTREPGPVASSWQDWPEVRIEWPNGAAEGCKVPPERALQIRQFMLGAETVAEWIARITREHLESGGAAP
jgi:hypothetical protein